MESTKISEKVKKTLVNYDKNNNNNNNNKT